MYESFTGNMNAFSSCALLSCDGGNAFGHIFANSRRCQLGCYIFGKDNASAM